MKLQTDTIVVILGSVDPHSAPRTMKRLPDVGNNKSAGVWSILLYIMNGE